jgi:hypothetical protein
MLTYADVCWGMKGVLEAAVVESYVDLLAANLKGTPVHVRVGAEDRSVLPCQHRRMPTYADVCRRMLTYADVGRCLRGNSGACSGS